MRRTLAWDGIVAQVEGADAIREVVDWAERAWPAVTRERPWDVIAEGNTPADDTSGAAATVGAHEAAGATWWIESDWESGTVETIRRRIKAGPPRPRS
jgi:hypothetical protein